MAVAFDAVGPSSSGQTSTSSANISWSHTSGTGAGTVLVFLAVGIAAPPGNALGSFTSVTYNGNAMTLLGSVAADNSDGGGIFCYGITGQSSGGSVTVATTGYTLPSGATFISIVGVSLSFTGGASFGTAATAFGSSASASVSVSTSDTAGLVAGGVASGTAGTSSLTSGTQRWDEGLASTSGAGNTIGGTAAANGGSVAITASIPNDFWGIIAVEVKAPAASAALTGTGSLTTAAQPNGASLTGTGSLTTFPESRNPLLWPFASNSIWNMPIGSGATYVDVGMSSLGFGPNGTGNFTPMPNIDDERIFTNASAPQISIQYSSAGWSGTSRCTVTGGSVAGLPITVPADASFTVPGTDPGNDSAAFLLADGRTISQCQPLAICTAGGNGTSIIAFANVDLYGTGITGAHGGSGLSAFGGSIRVGELRPGQTGMRHALKIEVDAGYVLAQQTSQANCFRWPATNADSDALTAYGQFNATMYSGMKSGALMAIPASVSLSSLGLSSSTGPGMQLAWTLQNYGAYIVDTGGESSPVSPGSTGAGYAICAENGPNGSVRTQFQSDWGMSLFGRCNDNTNWTNDFQKCMEALQLVDNNSATSIGGGGTPLQPLAPPIFPPGATESGPLNIILPGGAVRRYGPLTVTLPAPKTALTGFPGTHSTLAIRLPALRTAIKAVRNPLRIIIGAPRTGLTGKVAHNPLHITFSKPRTGLAGARVHAGSFTIALGQRRSAPPARTAGTGSAPIGSGVDGQRRVSAGVGKSPRGRSDVS